jgi:hypothetical protein
MAEVSLIPDLAELAPGVWRLGRVAGIDRLRAELLQDVRRSQATRGPVSYTTTIVSSEAGSLRVWDLVRDHLPPGERYTRTTWITHGCASTPIARHRDAPQYPGTHKLLIYGNALQVPMDSTEGGTRFFGSREDPWTLEVAHEPGLALLFDMRLEHEGIQTAMSQTKESLGLRILCTAAPSERQEIQPTTSGRPDTQPATMDGSYVAER